MLNGAKFLAAIVMFTIALVAANTAAMAVRERRHEMAVMRAIGFTRNSIVGRILVEGLIVGVTGACSDAPWHSSASTCCRMSRERSVRSRLR